MRNATKLILASLCGWIALAGSAMAEKRVALVIGNSTYLNAGQLPNPGNDASDMEAALKQLGVQVILGIDLDKAGMDRKIRDFANSLEDADAGLFFYAGHGLQVSGVNYLVPIDAQLTTASALDFEMVRLDLIQRTMEGATKTNILFLDACRDNPLARNLARAMGTRSANIGRGLAAAESGVGTLISYSTQPGNVALDGGGRNSPYAAALVKQLGLPSEDLQSLLISVRRSVMEETKRKQVPWEHSALTDKFYFAGAAQRAPAPAAAQPIPQAPAKETRAAPEQPRASLASYGPPAKAETVATRVNSFMWRTAPQEIDPGDRIWRRESDGTWSERWPSGFNKRSSTRARVVLDGCDGTVVGPDDEPDFALFIPDRGCKAMFIRFRRGASGPWHMLAQMNNVR